jgi:quercetin dioxygenase-like cupin family protein
MSQNPPYPGFIKALPQADLPMEGVSGYILGGPTAQGVFFEIPAGSVVPEHSHGDQWGVVLAGEIEFTVEGETRHCKPGDSYYVPAGAVHGAKTLSDARILEVFDDPNRWTPRE